MARSRLHELSEHGVSVWIDSLSREMLETGELARLVEEDAVVGVTSNPTIFQKALSEGDWYDVQLREAAGGAGRQERALRRPRPGGHPRCLRPAADRSGSGRAGSTATSRSRSTRRSPTTATRPSSRRSASTRRSTGRTSTSRSRGRSPGSARSRTRSREGRSINVTLIFGLERYAAVVEAYLRGLERLVEAGGDPGSAPRLRASSSRGSTPRPTGDSTRSAGPSSRASSRSRTRSSPIGTGRRRSPAPAGPPSRPKAPRRSGVSGLRPRRRTPPTATCSTSRSSSARRP